MSLKMAKKNPIKAVRKKHVRKPISRKKPTKSANKWKWISLMALLIASAVIVYFSFSEKKTMTVDTFKKSIPAGFESIGLDVSHHQGDINWEKLMVKSGFDSIIQFVYCKATEGNTHLDTKWERNRKALNNLGIPNGAYHFFIPTNPPRPQAEHFINNWKKRDIDLAPVLDVETEGFSDKDLIAKMKIWLTQVEQKSGVRPIIYTSLHFYETKFQNEFQDYQFWIASYSRKPSCINDKRIIHWQYSETGTLPGLSELVDLSVSKLKY